MKRFLCVMLAAVSVIAMCACGSKKAEQTNEDAVQIGTEAPDFTVSLTSGTRFELEKNDKVVLLNFWATWCGPCVNEMPAIQKIYEEYGDQIQVIGANAGEDRDTVDAFLKKNDYSYPVCYDMDGKLSALYPTDGVPYTVIIGKDNKIAATFYGAKDVDDQYKKLAAAIDEALDAE